ncbi:cadmium-translocating P-type ATPase [Thermaerobacter sp. PB12/4term]|uniref:heavy metal translocating P-type ATPase n=1 Tax=Thermaerobacter sp. PB12/4term TaxID=2293838 RepID=UPI000E3276DF|nr:heavy metal translocating P-type ATPase [Thermaerobacter sp. PB12/4term]QIA27833.1 cadmium-translocating P-type ATPase [Thermaerobacter sp. PB12/4term]
MATPVRPARLRAYTLEGMDCARCAQRIEEALRREPGLEGATVSYATATVLLPPGQVDRARAVIARVEPGARLQAQEAGAASPGHPAEEAPAPRDPHQRARQEPRDTGAARRLAGLAGAALVFLAALGLETTEPAGIPSWLPGAMLLAVYAATGYGVIGQALRNLRHGRLFDENFLMTLATAGAIAMGELAEAAAVMLFYTAGEFVQDLAVRRSRRSIRALLDLRPRQARVRRGGRVEVVDPAQVSVGETIVVRPGDRIPLDGRVVEGESFVDASALTGEPVPRRVEPGATVLAGMVNGDGALAVQVSRPYADSQVARILSLVEEAAARKAPTERFITTFARYYTPAVVAAAALLAVVPPLVLPGAAWDLWLRRALVLLVIACPCALVLSVPLGYFAGLGAASRRGILVKGAHFLDALARLDTMVWDKTGTLTRGEFEVVEVAGVAGAPVPPGRMLELAAHAELHSGHPIARALARAYGQPLDGRRVREAWERAGGGVRARVDGHLVVAGSPRFLREEGIAADLTPCLAPEVGETAGAPATQGTTVLVAVDGRLAGRIVIADRLKPGAPAAVRSLRRLGVRRQVMLTGDAPAAARAVAAQLGLDEVRAGLLPEEKVAALAALEERLEPPGRAPAGGWRRQGSGGGRGRSSRPAVAFAGDGINDAPVLTRATVGVAMGGLGSDAAIEAADVVIMDDDPSRLAEAVKVARATRRVVQQNIVLALAVKAIVAGLGAGGVATLWEAVFADVGVALLAVLNATRILRR